MNENLNLVKILKDCPKGTKLYSTTLGEVEFDHIDNRLTYGVIIRSKDYGVEGFTVDGKKFSHCGECILFPSKEQRDWSKFKFKKSKFDPKTFNPFDRVLIRDSDTQKWSCDFFSHIDYSDNPHTVHTTFLSWEYCIPYNDETKHLVGTTEKAPEYYRYWED